MNFATTDLCDSHEDLIAKGHIRVVAPIFKSYGGRIQFHGAAVTLKVFEDNSWVLKDIVVDKTAEEIAEFDSAMESHPNVELLQEIEQFNQ